MPINLFELHDITKDDKPKKWICAKGKYLHLEIKRILDCLVKQGISKTHLVKYLIKKLKISKPTSQRLVYLRKGWLPLIYIKELLVLSNKENEWVKVQEKIEFLKANQPPLKIVKAVKELNVPLCKIGGAHAADGTVRENYFCISDRYKSNLLAFSTWLKHCFELNYVPRQRGENEWLISFHNKVFSRYLRNILGFPNGSKTETVGEPPIIKNSERGFRTAFALGAMTFEAGVGIKNQVELCVLSKKFRDDIAEILNLQKLKFTNMGKRSGRYWRLWSGKLNQEESKKWLQLFEPHTTKWNKLYCHCYGNSKKVKSFDDALKIFELSYPIQTASKVSIADILFIIRKLGKTHRYEIVNELVQKRHLKSYGGKWAHSLAPYLKILKNCGIIRIEREKFGQKKSFGSIIREVYVYNPAVLEWTLPDF